MLDFNNEKDRKRDEALNNGLKAIEEKYKDFFKERKGKYETDEHDKLEYHWIIITRGGQIKFSVNDDSGLPEYIRKECYQVFHDVYGVKASKE
jgi:hypothetical protein